MMVGGASATKRRRHERPRYRKPSPLRYSRTTEVVLRSRGLGEVAVYPIAFRLNDLLYSLGAQFPRRPDDHASLAFDDEAGSLARLRSTSYAIPALASSAQLRISFRPGSRFRQRSAHGDRRVGEFRRLMPR